MLSVCSSSIGTRYSMWLPVKRAFGHRHTRPIVHSSSRSLVSARMRLYWKPYSNSLKSTLTWCGEYGPVPPFRRRLQFEWVHSKCTGSIEFSWHWNQLHGILALTIWRKPFGHEKNSQSGTNGCGSGPRYAHIEPP